MEQGLKDLAKDQNPQKLVKMLVRGPIQTCRICIASSGARKLQYTHVPNSGRQSTSHWFNRQPQILGFLRA